MITNSLIKLHPKNYKELCTPFIFYFNYKNTSEEQFQKLINEMSQSKSFVLTSYKKNDSAERRYSLYIGHCVINFAQSMYFNFRVTSILYGNKATEMKNNLYKTKIFTIIPTGGVYGIYNNNLYPSTFENSWKMNDDVFNDLVDSMDDYFEAVADESETDSKEDRVKISERFKRNIIRPFRDYTAKEQWVEEYKQYSGEGVSFYKREFVKKNSKGSTYNFYSNDENADPEKNSYNVGDRLTVVDSNEKGIYTGVLDGVDDESADDAVIFTISFYHQADDVDFPGTGKLVLSVNDTQAKVRKRVINTMERGKLESKYMYKVFDNFKTGGYEEIPDDLKLYLREKMADKYPPNQMQLEAIIKGILTDDLLLVLGPPGTGKTTVISFWVEYFIRKGQRVLISSQNNAAVDNVIARFGEMAETVRLGNENKVQENCKQYLPQNKIASMHNAYNDNHNKVMTALSHNKEEIRQYREKINNYQELFAKYLECKGKYDQYVNTSKSNIRAVYDLHSAVANSLNRLEAILDLRSRKEIFLEVYETKGFLEKFFKRKYAQRVKQELLSTELDMQNSQNQYMNAVAAYNNKVKEIADYNNWEREQNIVAGYSAAYSALHEYKMLFTNSSFIPNFEGELESYYKAPTIIDNIDEDHRTIMNQITLINSLQKTIEQSEKALNEWNSIINNNRNDIMQNVLLEECQIVGATCIGINSNREFANVKFDVAIVDEAGQIQIHNALIPMSRAKKNLLLGDYKQIPPCANDEVVAACKAEEIDVSLLNMSFFEYAFGKMRSNVIEDLKKKGLDKSEMLRPDLEYYVPEPYKKFDLEIVQNLIKRVCMDPKKLVNLNSQFRMPGNISDIISEWFYEGNYHSSYDMKRFEAMVPGTDKPLVVVNTNKASGRNESQPASKMGYQNHYEARIIADMVADIIEAQPEDTVEDFVEHIEDNIGIISAYGAQVRLIREYLIKKNLGIKNTQIRSMVASLDSFQGQERPLILYSLTRSTTYKKPENGRVGFMKELRRLNVAFTRCQKQLVIIGDVNYLTECMNMEQVTDEADKWPCSEFVEKQTIDQEMIDQCAECPAICERKFARFMRLLMQHVNEGAGNLLESDEYMKRNA